MSEVFFQEMVRVSEQFANEGLILIWNLRPHLYIFSEEAVKIFSYEPASTDKSPLYVLLQEIFGLGLLTSNGERWKKHRKMFNPVFHVGMLKEKISIFNENAETLVKQLSEVTEKPSVILLDYLKITSFSILCESLMGIKMNNEENKNIIRNYMVNITKLFEYTTYRSMHPWMRFKFLLYLTPSGRKHRKLYEENRKFTEKIILEMKKSIVSRKTSEDDSESHDHNRKSFTHILIEFHLKDPSFTLYDLQNEITTFMAAGFHTVSYSMMWCLFMLGLYKEVQERVYDEVVSETGKFITYDDLCKLEYMECVIKETLRLYPTVPVYARELKKDVQCGKYTVPKGMQIFFFLYSLHRDPKIYPDPEKFIPDRFLDGNSEKRPWVHVPFAEGIRSCIGKKFAMMEMKVILAHLLRNYRVISLDKREDVNVCWEEILTPAKPIRMKLIPRKTAV